MDRNKDGILPAAAFTTAPAIADSKTNETVPVTSFGIGTGPDQTAQIFSGVAIYSAGGGSASNIIKT